MKALVCDICGSNEIVKDGEYFVCQSCGTKYTTEAVRKMMVEITEPVTVTGSVVAENVATAENLMDRAKGFLREKNIEKAKEYIEKALDLEPQNPSLLSEKEIVNEYEKTTKDGNGQGCSFVLFFLSGIFFTTLWLGSMSRDSVGLIFVSLIIAAVSWFLFYKGMQKNKIASTEHEKKLNEIMQRSNSNSYTKEN